MTLMVIAQKKAQKVATCATKKRKADMADNLHRQFDHIEDFEIERRQTTNYQDDQGLNSNSIKLQDMIFFGRVSSFCVSTVLVAFLFLVAQVATFWAFFWAITISAIGQLGIYVLIEYLKAKER